MGGMGGCLRYSRDFVFYDKLNWVLDDWFRLSVSLFLIQSVYGNSWSVLLLENSFSLKGILSFLDPPSQPAGPIKPALSVRMQQKFSYFPPLDFSDFLHELAFSESRKVTKPDF